MNNTSKEQVENKSVEPKALDQALGSQFALQVALQTMKERCQNLQLRLSNVEEENVYLRSKKYSPVLDHDSSSSDAKGEVQQLQEQVSQLTRQKTQLTHHIYMVATENQQLWNRLSRVTQANQSLGSHLSKISDTLSKHDSTGSSKAEFNKLPVISNCIAKQLELKGLSPSTNLVDNDQQSLDEISLKLINSLIQEKAELEDQYSQMVDIQSEHTFPIHNLGFAYMDQEDESTLKEVNEHCVKLQEMKEVLAKQHSILKSTFERFEKAKNDTNILCRQCKDKAKRQSVVESHAEDKAYMDTLRQWGAAMQTDVHRQPNAVATSEKTTSLVDTNLRAENMSPAKNTEDIKNEDRLCPMCGQFYPRQLPYEDFQAHVMTHFNDEFDPALENFEVVM